jgi:hypothetical protein
MTAIEEILDLARWAPSGDNTQPWRFVIEGPDRVTVYGHDTRAHCVYDLDGHPSQISLGALLETIDVAATRFGLRTKATRRAGSPDERPVFDVQFRSEAGLAEDPLVACIRERRVQRRPMQIRRLTESERAILEQSLGAGFRSVWFEGVLPRFAMASLNFDSAKIRLTIPEAYRVHRDVIAWNAQTSEDRIPDAALGAAGPTLKLMRWAMASWERVDFLNRYLAGTVAPRIELDFIPGLACAAHVVLVADTVPRSLDDYVAAGRALQRFWLTATRLALQFQPQYTPLVFARYAREAVRFSASVHAASRAEAVRDRLDRLIGPDVASRAVFMGRIGAGKPADGRSTRLPLERLLLQNAPPAT